MIVYRNQNQNYIKACIELCYTLYDNTFSKQNQFISLASFITNNKIKIIVTKSNGSKILRFFPQRMGLIFQSGKNEFFFSYFPKAKVSVIWALGVYDAINSKRENICLLQKKSNL